jgi:hypothetical protein
MRNVRGTAILSTTREGGETLRQRMAMAALLFEGVGTTVA